MKKIFKVWMIACLAILFSGQGNLFAYSVELNHTCCPTLAEFAPFGTVTWANTAADTMHFDVELRDGLAADLNGGQDFGLSAFSFNTDLAISSGFSIINNNVPVWPTSPISGDMGPFGTFDVRLRNGSTPHLWFDIWAPGQTLTEENFFFLSEFPDAGEGPGHFAAHIVGFDMRGLTETCVRDEPVPEPGTMVLLGISLLTAGGYLRRLDKRLN